jgi:hypothetical protein
MDQLDGDGALSDCGSYPFDRSFSYVAGGEDAGNAGLQ